MADMWAESQALATGGKAVKCAANQQAAALGMSGTRFSSLFPCERKSAHEANQSDCSSDH
jgi:hypothetical protein